MTERKDQPDRKPLAADSDDGLRQALLRLTSPHYVSLQDEIEALRKQILAFEAVWEKIESVRENLSHRDERLSQQDQELKALVEEAIGQLGKLEGDYLKLIQAQGEELNASARQFTAELEALRALLSNPQEVSNRVSPVLIPLIAKGARQNQDEFAEAMAPVIGPAIRRQIRDAKQDIIDALYPLIGEIIGKAISEAIRELTRKIDTRLRQQLNFRSRLRIFLARLRGVSESELLMREALPYTIQHIFLIHYQTGILLQHLPASGQQAEDTDLISGMLTAIRDFVHDSFGRGIGDLEEVAYGEQRILLEGGRYAYLAVVVEGVEPEGYAQRMHEVIAAIHLHAERALRAFNGRMEDLPNFQKLLSPLATTAGEGQELGTPGEALGRSEKLILSGGMLAILIVLGLLAFGCIFTIRLWPVAFPGHLPSATPTLTPPPPQPSLTASLTMAITSTVRPTATAMKSNTPHPTDTATPERTLTPTALVGTLLGNLYLRAGPSTDHAFVDTLVAGEQVRILHQQGGWYLVQWPAVGEPSREGWLWSRWIEVGE